MEHRSARNARLRAGAPYAKGKHVAASDATALLEAVLQPGDRVCLEGDNKKMAEVPATALAAYRPGAMPVIKVRDEKLA